MRRIRAMSLGIRLIINNGVSSSGRIPDITGEASQVNSILAERSTKCKAAWESEGTVLTDSFSVHYPCISAADGDMYLLPKHSVRYLASRASIGKYGAHCPKYGFPPMSRL